MKVYIIRHGEVPHNALKQYNNENVVWYFSKIMIILRFSNF